MNNRQSVFLATGVVGAMALLARTIERIRARHAATPAPDDRWTAEEMLSLLILNGADPVQAAVLAPIAHRISGGDPSYVGVDAGGTLRIGLYAVPINMEGT